jgi:hypothetical protein
MNEGASNFHTVLNTADLIKECTLRLAITRYEQDVSRCLVIENQVFEKVAQSLKVDFCEFFRNIREMIHLARHIGHRLKIILGVSTAPASETAEN